MKDCFPKDTQTIISIILKSNKKKSKILHGASLQKALSPSITGVIAPSLGGSPEHSFPLNPSALRQV